MINNIKDELLKLEQKRIELLDKLKDGSFLSNSSKWIGQDLVFKYRKLRQQCLSQRDDSSLVEAYQCSVLLLEALIDAGYEEDLILREELRKCLFQLTYSLYPINPQLGMDLFICRCLLLQTSMACRFGNPTATPFYSYYARLIDNVRQTESLLYVKQLVKAVQLRNLSLFMYLMQKLPYARSFSLYLEELKQNIRKDWLDMISRAYKKSRISKQKMLFWFSEDSLKEWIVGNGYEDREGHIYM